MTEKKKHISILIADDNPNNLKVLKDTLTSFGYQVRIAVDGKTAVTSARAETPDLIMLDVHMPEMDGYAACRILKNDPRTKDVPVIFVSAINEEFNKVQAFEAGGIDYIAKPIQIEEMKARLSVHLTLKEKLKELEEFNKAMVDREMRIIELKRQVNNLSAELGRDVPYPEDWEDR